jgi:hypothetical protein
MWQNQPTEADIAADKVKEMVIQDAIKKLKRT